MDFAHIVTKFLVMMIMFCVFMFVFTKREEAALLGRDQRRG